MVGGILSGISDLAMTSKYEKSHRVDTPDVKQPEIQKSEEPKKESVNKSEEVKQEDEEQDTPNLALGRNIL